MVTCAHGEHLARKRKSEDSLKILSEEPQTKYRKLEKGIGQSMYQRKDGDKKIKDKEEKDETGPEQAGIDVAQEEKLFRDSVTPSIKLFVFNIVLPTIDIFLDIVLIPKLFKNGFWGSGTIVVAGIVTSFTFTCLAWWRMESRKQKKWSWIFLLLQLWPQLRALQVAVLMRIYKSSLVPTVPFLVNSETWSARKLEMPNIGCYMSLHRRDFHRRSRQMHLHCMWQRENKEIYQVLVLLVKGDPKGYEEKEALDREVGCLGPL